jgi:hypothetical protein
LQFFYAVARVKSNRRIVRPREYNRQQTVPTSDLDRRIYEPVRDIP